METQRYVPQAQGSQLIIIEQNQIRTCALEERPQWIIGRYDPSSNIPPDITLSSKIVSRNHGQLMHIENHWYYVDNPGNLNGTFHNGKKIERPLTGKKKVVPLESGDVLRIDNDDLNNFNKDGVLMMFSTAPVKGRWTAFPLEERQHITIGRDESCDIVEPLPYLSAKHAQISYSNGTYYLSDCKSKAGTFLNGKRVESPVALCEKDCISLCDRTYFFLGDQLLYAKSDRKKERKLLYMTLPNERPVILRADIKSKQVKNNSGTGMKELIRDIRLEIREGTLVALLGTAGAGKSTVMSCLNGMDLEGVQGSVLYRDVELMKHFDQMKYLIGNVPQKKTFHPFFTPEREFTYAARKRLPADMSSQEIKQRVDKTLELLSMTGVRKSRNYKLSGGEQTRVNVGIELVADRDFLCLDEPDQGLSPNYKHELFEILRNLAHKNGKSVLAIIHDVSEINLFDQVIMLAKVDGVGRLAFSGTPTQARAFFGVDICDAYALLEREPQKFVR